MRSSECSSPTETRTVFSVIPAAARAAGGHRCVAHGGGEGDERFDATEGFGDVEEAAVHTNFFGDGPAITDVEGEHCAEAFLLAFGKFVLGV